MFRFIGKHHYCEDKKSRNFKVMENNDWEIAVSKNNDLKAISNGQPLFISEITFPKIFPVI